MQVVGDYIFIGSLRILGLQCCHTLSPDAGLSDEEESGDAGKKMVTATKKGRAVLDPNLPERIKRDYHVYEEVNRRCHL